MKSISSLFLPQILGIQKAVSLCIEHPVAKIETICIDFAREVLPIFSSRKINKLKIKTGICSKEEGGSEREKYFGTASPWQRIQA